MHARTTNASRKPANRTITTQGPEGRLVRPELRLVMPNGVGEGFSVRSSVQDLEGSANRTRIRHRDQKVVPSRDTNATPHPSIRNGTQEAVELKIPCSNR
jgi:hypothetical protein